MGTIIAIGAGLAVLAGAGAGIGIGIVTSKATEAVARQLCGRGKNHKDSIVRCGTCRGNCYLWFRYCPFDYYSFKLIR